MLIPELHHLLPNQNADDQTEAWRQAHVFAMPSRVEGFGMVYVEAMRQGLPVIASMQDAGQEVNIDGETGRNVDLNRPGALESALVELLSDADHARRMGEAGRRHWNRAFRYSNFKERFLGALGSGAAAPVPD